MRNSTSSEGIGTILKALSQVSTRPRYAFAVLQLVAEVADRRGRAGPWIAAAEGPMPVRDWLCTQLMPLSEQQGRRSGLRERVVARLGKRLSGDPQRDGPLIEAHVADQVLITGRANVSRAVSDLVRARLLQRHYAGYATDHHNRGGGRHAVYEIAPEVMRLLGRPVGGLHGQAAPRTPRTAGPMQGDLFA